MFGNFKMFKAGLIITFMAATVGQIGKEVITEYGSIAKDIYLAKFRILSILSLELLER